MSSPPDPQRSAAIRAALEAHAALRLSAALAKVAGADAKSEEQRKKETAFFNLDTLLTSGAECASQIQLATHIVKGVNPDAKVKEATNLNVNTAELRPHPLLGSHVLGVHAAIDATGNGAYNKKIFEVSLLLTRLFEGVSILGLLKNGDVDAMAALSKIPKEATWIASELAEIDATRCSKVSSSGRAKQLYWPVGNDPHDNGQYHLLAPLYPTSLVHKVYLTLQDDRFSDAAKAAREARKAGARHERPVREYPQLAIQTLGGTKPQNISQLNSERRGNNSLLASLPPVWQSADVKPLWGADSLFTALRWRPGVRTLLTRLRSFLESDPARNRNTRAYRDDLVEDLLDELLQFGAGLQALEPGWTADIRCELPHAHMAWLDPQGSDAPTDDLIDRLASDFARWLNHQLLKPLPLGDDEYLHWRAQARALFKAWEREELHDFA